MFINDVAHKVHSQVRMLADDFIYYYPIHSTSGCEIFQEGLQVFEKWGEEWKMQFNVYKFFIMNITLAKKNITKFEYCMN